MHDMEKIFVLHTPKELLKINKENTSNRKLGKNDYKKKKIIEGGNQNG